MAIQIPNPGTGNGASGDNEFVLWSKVKDNFSDQTNAASRLLGASDNRIPLAQDTLKAALSTTPTLLKPTEPAQSVDSLESGSWVLLDSPTAKTSFLDAPFDSFPQVLTMKGYAPGSRIQIAFPYITKGLGVWFRYAINSGTYSSWIPMSQTEDTYKTTTAAGANTVVDTSGKLMRSTSSERYKDILSPLELDDARYADAMALKPIVYRSTADADNPAYHYYSFSAEELGAYDPAFTLWRETETATDADGNVSEQPLSERQAEGININALLAMSHAIAIKQGELIKGLQEQINALKAKLEV